MSERVRAAVRRLAKGQPVIFTGQAEQVDVGAGTCSVIPSDGGPPYFEVSLKAHPDAKAYVLPVEGSEVVCAQLTDQVVIVIGVAQPDIVIMEGENKIMIKAWNSSLEVESDGIGIKAGGQSLKTVLNDLLTALQTLAPISAAPGSPCVPNPIDVGKFQAMTAQLQLLLK